MRHWIVAWRATAGRVGDGGPVRRRWGMVRGIFVGVVASIGWWVAGVRAAEGPGPGIVLILADDMGFGDIGAFNEASRIPTPNLDRLAREGRRFTDMHAPASWCTPSRYGLLTGRYPWRYEAGFARRDGYAGHLIGSGEATVASLLKERGYATACVGKWHLGLGPRDGGPDYRPGVRIPHGPNDIGFDYSYILPASLDMPPYGYLEDQVLVAALDGRVEDHESEGMRWAAGEFWRGGPAEEGFDFHKVLPRFRDRALDFLERRAEASDGRPFFLYLPLTAPHTPWMPLDEFRGRSGAGMYGDFVVQVDAFVGDILDRLEDRGMTGDTLVLFTSDNGAFWTAEEQEEFGHRANGPWRGGKLDAWEGGHRVPFIARWPGKIPAGTTCDALLCFTDLMATLAAVTGEAALPAGAGEDSRDASEVLFGGEGGDRYAVRESLVLAAGPGFAVRERDWKLINFLGSGGFTPPKSIKPEPGEPTGQLYDLAADPGETTNRHAERPDQVEALGRLIPSAPRQSPR